MSRIDHVILAVNDLQHGVEELERLTGVRAAYGGTHPGRGTQNALLSLGAGRYLEVIAPNPDDVAGAEAARRFDALTSLTPVGWAVGVDDVDAVRAALQARGAQAGHVQPGARARPDGRRLEWRTLAVERPSHDLLPFFIQWSAGSAHPSATEPAGCTLRSFHLEDPAPDALRAALQAAGVDAPVRAGDRQRIVLSLDCPRGTTEFR